MREAQGPAWTDWLSSTAWSRSTGVDTRSLVLHLRDRGAMRAAIVADGATEEAPEAERRRRWRAARSSPASRRPSRTSTREVGRADVAVVDYGSKRSILRRLAGSGAAVTVFPHDVDADELARHDGVVLSNGPGDPDPLVEETAVVRDLLGRVPVLGICLGHQLLGLATGHETFKLPFGHRGANHPVLERASPAACSSRPRTTASRSSRPRTPRRRRSRSTTAPSRASTFPELHARSVQFHPEAGPGPARRLAAPRDLGRGGCAAGSTDIESICLIGSGPIVIGQACEFDYAGCQALKVLREDGFRTIVVNSNPATIMTDPGFADRTYLEPLDLEGVADVLERERPDALLPTLGGQTALNLAMRARRGGHPRRRSASS